MKTFAELKAALEEQSGKTGKYRGVSYRISNNVLYVDNEKIDVYKNEKEAEKAAKEFIQMGMNEEAEETKNVYDELLDKKKKKRKRGTL